MPSLLVVDNYLKPGDVDELVGSFRAGGASVEVTSPTECSGQRFGRYDGVVLSGSPVMLSEAEGARNYSKEVEAIRESPAPILGVCFGHQLLGIAYGSRVIRNPEGTRRYVENDVVAKAGLFDKLSSPVSVFESHYEVVEELPEGFSLLATSPTSPIGAMRHERLRVWGTQFHPEHNDSAHPDGRMVVRNFVLGLG